MKKLVISLAALALVVAFLATAGSVFAQGPTNPPTPQDGTGAYGRGPRGGMMANNSGVEGPLHDYMVAAFADKLGMSATDLEARLDAGATVGQIAGEQGLAFDQFRTLMLEARTDAAAKAVADGVLTQDQADWMSQRGAAMGRGAGMGMGRGAGRGMGAGAGNFANCPYATQ